MKQFKYLLIIVSASLFFGSCKKDDKSNRCKHKITLQPDSNYGKDANIFTEVPNHSGGNYRGLSIAAWTWYALGYDDGIMRGLVQFDLSSVPSDAEISSANLTLYNDPNSSENTGMHSQRNGSNKAKLELITETWDEQNITWNNQPKTSTAGSIQLPASTSSYQNYKDINITSMVKKWHSKPSENNGFMIKLNDEKHYRCLIFASSDHLNPKLHPKLEVTYLK